MGYDSSQIPGLNSFNVNIHNTKKNKTKKQKKKQKKTPVVKFLDLIFRNNFFIFNFSKMCSR